jgi:uncharacterized integral membrane protein (TIGR00698 family)
MKLIRKNCNPATYLIPGLALLTLTPFISSGIALILGIVLSLSLGNPYLRKTQSLTRHLLSIAVVGLGAGMDLGAVGKVGLQGVLYTVTGIGLTFFFGISLGLILKTGKTTSLLITVGTAICGGSAIAAVAPTVRAKPHEISVALGTVFLLNALALFIFPWVGHQFGLSQTQFGLWAALAIHDTSSVVGATLQYGSEALQVGTTVKLTRALWIVPVTFFIGYFYSRRQKHTETKSQIRRPWFILGFLAVAALVTWIPELRPMGHWVELVAKRVLVLTLFLIGANLTRDSVAQVGIKPLIQGIGLWIIVASGTLEAILLGLIH